LKISHIKIKNFRTFNDFSQDVGKYNLFVGKNNTGKSNLLWAIYCFYYPNNLNKDDIRKDSNGNRVANEFEIELTFDELNAEEQRNNNKYYHNGKLKIQLRGWIDENGNFKSEHHGYIQKEKLIFPPDFDESLKKLLQSLSPPKKADLNNFPELYKITQKIQSKGQITKENWVKIKNEFIIRHSEIERKPQERLAEEKYQGFVRTREVNKTGDCIFIPAKRDPSEVLKTEGTKSPIRQLIEILVGDITSEEIKDDFQKVREKINQERAEKIKNLEKKFKDELTLWKTDVNIDLKTFDISEVLPLKFDVLYNDGVPTNLERKGTGLQRYIFFKFLKISNEMRLGENISLILLFEEPEAHLHPQIQREIANILKELSEKQNYQIFITTHSPQFIDIQNLDEIYICTKNNNGYSELNKCGLKLSSDLKENIKISLFFDPHVCEIFFADRIVLIEGQSEEIAINFMCQKGLLNVSNVSIINAKSKHNIPTFLKVFNSLKIPYCVMVDEDPYFEPYFKKKNPDKIKDKRKHYNKTIEISKLINKSLGKMIVVCPDFDTFLGVSKNQIKDKGKPTAIYNILESHFENNDAKFKDILQLIKDLINPIDLKYSIVDHKRNQWKKVDVSNIKIPNPDFSYFKSIIINIINKFSILISQLTQNQLDEIIDLFKNKKKNKRI